MILMQIDGDLDEPIRAKETPSGQFLWIEGGRADRERALLSPTEAQARQIVYVLARYCGLKVSDGTCKRHMQQRIADLATLAASLRKENAELRERLKQWAPEILPDDGEQEAQCPAVS